MSDRSLHIPKISPRVITPHNPQQKRSHFALPNSVGEARRRHRLAENLKNKAIALRTFSKA
ncbi:hypothetical protein [Nostoc sp.]|uniref:hypothetical protein n=1 Tax=Nostoc sp. TaxID=1180 RepID=UPI002FFC5760